MTELTIDRAMQLAIENHKAGAFSKAEEIYRQVLLRQPNHPDALHLLGVICLQSSRPDAAIEFINRAIKANPGVAKYHNNLANALRSKGLLVQAIAAYREAVRLNPENAETHYNLGVALREQGSIDDAIVAYQNAIICKTDFFDARNDLGSALREKGLLDQAILYLRGAVQLRPQMYKAYNNLANALHEKGELTEAAAVLRQAIAIEPGVAELYNNLATILRDVGQLEESAAALNEAIRLRPDFPEAHFNLSVNYLQKGEYTQAWPEFKYRWQCRGFPSPRGQFAQPRWDGEPLDGRTIFLHSEAGFGDTIQFVRYAPMVASRGGKVILECQPALLSLMQGISGVERVIATNEPLPSFDLHCPMMNLPLAFGTILQSIPAAVPYIHADPSLIEIWRARLGSAEGELKVGLVWAGNTRFRWDRSRSIELTLLSPLGGVSGVRFYNLQKGPPAIQAENPPPGLKMTHLGSDLHSFADTAAAMSCLDLIICTDTSSAHLAGALGRPTWLLLQFMPDWRWLLQREDSPWYPTMRLFRQRKRGDWVEAVNRVAESLSELVRSGLRRQIARKKKKGSDF